MSTAKSQVPQWINIRHPGECVNCGERVEAGETALYEWATQKFLRCMKCDLSAPKQPDTRAVVTATGKLPEESEQPWPRAADPIVQPATPKPAATPASPLVQLLASIEAFARANVAAGDVRKVSDRMIAAVVRAAAEV